MFISSTRLIQRCLKIPMRMSSSSSSSSVRLLVSESNDPIFNLATEEWIFRDLAVDENRQLFSKVAIVTMILSSLNAPCLVIGRNQNAWKECNIQQMEEDKVTLARRQSGGGAVYQDLGNTCFTFLSHSEDYDKNRNMEILARALRSLGVEATPSGRNDITVEGRKISGSAFKQARLRSFHHGTMLINVDMGAMQRLLNPNKAKLESKGVKSVQARVLNLAERFPHMSHELVCDAIASEFFRTYGSDATPAEVLDEAFLRAQPNVSQYYERYSDWAWRFGNNPSFTHHLETRFDWGTIDIHVDVERGKITRVEVFSDCLLPELVDAIRTNLLDAPYDLEGVERALQRARNQLIEHGNEPAAQLIPDVGQWLRAAM